MAATTAELTEAEVLRKVDSILGLVKQANAGSEPAMASLRKHLEDSPELWRHVCDLGFQAQMSWIVAIVGEKPAYQEGVRRNLREMRRELLGESPTILERLLVARILACWLPLQYAESVYAQRMSELNTEWGTYYQERISRCQKRYLAAIKALAQIRRLQLPMLQVNVGAGVD